MDQYNLFIDKLNRINIQVLKNDVVSWKLKFFKVIIIKILIKKDKENSQ